MLTLEIKLIIAAVLVVLLGGTYYWTYNQGKKVGKADGIAEQYHALSQALKDNDAENKALREKEMREANAISQDFQKYHQRKVKQLEDANRILQKEANKVCGSQPVDPDFISVLNSAGVGSPAQG